MEGGEALPGLAAVPADTVEPQDRAWYQMVQVWLAVHHHPPRLRLDSAWLAATLHNMVATVESCDAFNLTGCTDRADWTSKAGSPNCGGTRTASSWRC